jgi:hypothetical protein
MKKWLRLGLAGSILIVAAGCTADSRTALPSEDAAASPVGPPVSGSLHAGNRSGDAEVFAALLADITRWGGQIEFDSEGGAIAIDLHAASISDADLERLATLPHLQRLHLKGAEITDASMPALARLSGLTILDLDTVAVTDEGVHTLTALKNLHSVRLHRLTRLTDAVAEHFLDLPRLEHLVLTDSYISDGGLFYVSQLKNLRTNLRHGETGNAPYPQPFRQRHGLGVFGAHATAPCTGHQGFLGYQ